MTRFERWFLRRIIRKEVRQGFTHHIQIEGLFKEIIDSARREFYEDNRPTQDEYLTDWFKNALVE